MKTYWKAWARLLVRRLKRLLEFAGYTAFDRLALLGHPPRARHGRVALVHVGLLGDAFMALPYVQALARKLARDGKSSLVVCEQAVREVFAEALPGAEVFALPKKAFLHDAHARWRILQALRAHGAERAYHFWSPRDGILQDAIVRALGAPAVGFEAVYADRPEIDVKLSRRLYSVLVPSRPGVHLGVQYRAFLQALDDGDFPVKPLEWPLQKEPPIEQPYWLLVPGASREFRRWPEQRFAEVAAHVLRRRPDWRCVIVGSAAEQTLGKSITERLGDRAINLAGQTTVLEWVEWIAHARLLLGNDSAAGHIAAAMGTPAVVVAGGGHWGLCYPYDANEAPVRRLPLAVGLRMPCYGCDWRCVHTLRAARPFPCIAGVTAEDVVRAVDGILEEVQPSKAASIPSDAPTRDTRA